MNLVASYVEGLVWKNIFVVQEISVKHVNVTALIRKYKLDERQLQKIHAMYIAQKIADSTAQGKISTGMDTLEFAQSLRNKADMNSTASDWQPDK